MPGGLAFIERVRGPQTRTRVRYIHPVVFIFRPFSILFRGPKIPVKIRVLLFRYSSARPGHYSPTPRIRVVLCPVMHTLFWKLRATRVRTTVSGPEVEMTGQVKNTVHVCILCKAVGRTLMIFTFWISTERVQKTISKTISEGRLTVKRLTSVDT